MRFFRVPPRDQKQPLGTPRGFQWPLAKNTKKPLNRAHFPESELPRGCKIKPKVNFYRDAYGDTSAQLLQSVTEATLTKNKRFLERFQFLR